MNHIKFLQAIAARDYDGLLHDGGFDLTKDQLATVIRMSKEDSALELQRRGAEVASQPGYREFMTMPIMSQVGAQSQSVPTPNPTVQKAPEEKKQTKKDNKNPEFTSISAKNAQKLRVNDTEADVLGKLYNFLEIKAEFDNKRFAEAAKYRKEMDPLKEQKLEDIIAAFEGRESRAVKKKTNTETPAPTKSKAGKFAFLGAIGLGGLFLSESAFAGIRDLELDKLFSVFPEVGNLPDMEEPISDVEKLGGGADARVSAEKYLGREMSDTEWDQLLRATSAEAGSNTTEQAMVMAAILNRAREGKTVTKVLSEPNQFQAVTGTKVNPGPSKNFTTPFENLPQKRQQSILYGATNVLGGVDKNLKNFTAASEAAYGPGTNIEFRNEMLRKGGTVVGGSVFPVAPPTFAPSKPPEKLVGESPKEQNWDDMNKKWKEMEDAEEKSKSEKVSILNSTTNVMRGGTTYAFSVPMTNQTPALIDRVYNTYG